MDTPQKVITTPQGVYLVTFTGSLAAGEYVTIPRFNQRKGDRELNPLVYTVTQNLSGFGNDFPSLPAYPAAGSVYPDSSLPGGWSQWPRIRVLDETNALSGVIVWPNAWRLDTDQEMKLEASNFGYSGLALFSVAAFYKIPD